MNAPIFLRAQWRRLAILNFAIDPQILAPLIPRGVELDDFHGRTLISMVAFEFSRARLLGIPVPFHQLFPELNLRCYVRRRVNNEMRRGVVFLKEIVPKRAVVFVANRIFNESFTFAHVTYRHRGHRAICDVLMNDRTARLQLATIGAAHFPTPNSEACFVLDRSYAYNTSRRGATLEYHVEHPCWRVLPASVEAFEIDADDIYGPALGAAFHRPPTSALLADGSEVCVHRGVEIPGEAAMALDGKKVEQQSHEATKCTGTPATASCSS